jgi:hypothetical protein
MITTSRLGLEVPQSTDNESAFPAVSAQEMGILDNAAIYEEGTLVSRSNPSYHGQLYKTTDSGVETLSWFDGSVWLPLGLIPATTTSSKSVVSGQALIVTGSAGVTITLPSHSAGQLVAVFNRSTGGTTVSGSSIYGVGLSAASAFPLATIGSQAILMDDGSNWNIISGQQDTGWQNIAGVGGIIAAPGYLDPQVCLRGDKVEMKGAVKNSSAGTLPNGTTFANVTSTFFPTAAVLVPATNPAYGGIGVEINTSGDLFIPQTSFPTGGIITFDGCDYFLS